MPSSPNIIRALPKMTDQCHNPWVVNGHRFVVKSFDDLSNRELMAIYQLRQQVFIIEQDCPYPDIDAADLTAGHVFHKSNQGIDAYARVITDDQGMPHIGRVVVAMDQRHLGMGQALMQAAISYCQNSQPSTSIIISAQSYLADFYSSLGFTATGDYYLEDNIPHMQMILKPGS